MTRKILIVALVWTMVFCSFPAMVLGANVRDLPHPVVVPEAPDPLVAPTPPTPDTTVNLTAGTQAELVDAIENAQGGGHVTKIVLKADTGISIDTALPHFDLTDGQVLVIDFNGGWLEYNTATSFWFEAQHGTPVSVSMLDTVGNDATLKFSTALPDGLQVGDYVKVTAEEERPPGGRSNYLKLGEAMKVKAIDGQELVVTLEGKLLQQGLYEKQIRASKYFGEQEGLWLINPKMIGDLTYDLRQIKLISLIKPRILSPEISTSKGQFVSIEDNVEAIVTDPLFYDGVDGSYPNITYGIYSFASKNTWVYRTDGSTIGSNGYDIRHAIDSGANSPQNQSEIYRYGNDIGFRATGLNLWDTLNVNASIHSGSWGALLEDLNIRRNGSSAAAGITIRGDYHTVRNIDIAEVENGWQIYNERGEFTTSPIDTSPRELVIDGGSTVVSEMALFTSTDATVQMPIGTITTKNAPYWESSTSDHLFELDYQANMFMNGDVIKVTGDATEVFLVSGGAKLTANGITIDLSEYTGSGITLFHANEGSVINVHDLTLINPYSVSVTFSDGDGDVYDVSPTYFDSFREKWYDFLTGGTLNLQDPDILAKVEQIDDEAEGYWNSMDTSVNRVYLWSDLAGTTSAPAVRSNYMRLFSMALAWSIDGSDLYQDPDLLDDIIGGMDWMYQSRYNEYTAMYDNWWEFELGAPLAINDICVLLYDELTSEQIANYMRATLHFPPHNEFTGANRVWESMVNALRGVLMMDRSMIEWARDGLSTVFPYSTQYDGFYEDGSFLQHLKHPYNGGYGKSLLNNLTNIMYFLYGTDFDIVDPEEANFYKWIYDSYEPFIYKGSLMSMVRGREVVSIGQQEHGAGHRLIGYIGRASLFAPPEDALNYKRMIKAWMNEDTYDDMYEDLTIHELLTIKAIMEDDDITPRVEPPMFKYYGKMDRTLQKRGDYAFGISMHSARIFNYESVSGQNKYGWYTGDGMTYLYNGDLTQFSDYYWQTVNPYRMPGTTVDTRSRSSAEGQTKLGMDWVGGAGLDSYGVTGMHLKAFSSTENPSTLQAYKSWFMFDDEIVALGSNINSTDNRPIETIVDNRKLNANGNNAMTVDGTARSTTIGWNETMQDVDWIHLAGNAAGADMGYYFPDTTDVYGLREARTDDTQTVTRNYMNLVIDHGTNPSGAGYSYVLLPNRSESGVSSYASSPDITILQNDSSAQAVKENTLDITGINFWNNTLTTVGDVTSDKKASLVMREYTNALELSVSDPTQTNSSKISLEIDREAAGILYADPEITVTQLSPTIKFTVATKSKYGKAFKVKFALEDQSIIHLNPSGDAHVIDGSSSNYGTSTNLETRESETAGSTKRAYLKFDLSGVSGSGYTARLRVYGRSLASTTISTALHEVADDNWTEAGINWTNKPNIDDQLGTASVSTTYQWKDFDVTDFVKSQLDGDDTASFAMLSVGMDELFRMNSGNNSSNKPVLYLIPDLNLEHVATDDAYVRRGSSYSDTNFGSSSALAAKYHWSDERQTYLQFDLNALDANINKAKLKVYAKVTEGTGSDYQIYSVLDDTWEESVLTWNSKPVLEEEIGSVAIDDVYGWREIDLTNYIKEQLATDGIVSIAIIEDGSAGGHYVEMRSKEYSSTYAPRLILD